MAAALRSDSGSGRPLVYVPGIDGSGHLLLGTEARLARSFRVLTVRYRADPVSPRDESYPELARAVLDVVGERVEGPALLLGESFGVAVALQAALERPEAVAGLALVNGFSHHPWRVRVAVSRAVVACVPHALFRLGRRFAGPDVLLGPRREPGIEREFQAMTKTDLQGYRRRLALIQRLDLRPRLGEIRCPVAIFASADDVVVPSVPAARVMERLLPDVELEVIERAGHIVLPLPDEPWPERMERLAARCAARPGAAP